MNIETLVRKFESGELKQNEWHHKEHLIIALWYLDQTSELNATLKIKQGIMTYNLQYGINQTDQLGYHETVTMFFIRLAQGFLRNPEIAKLSFDQKVNEFTSAYPDFHETLQEFYSKGILGSEKARRQWVAPDLRPLDLVSSSRTDQSSQLRQAAEEFEKAKQHCLVAADHFESIEVPRGCAHTLASIGHAEKARSILNEVSVLHSKKARADL